MSYRLLFLDLDGTLVGRLDIVSARNRAALTAANEAGCTVVICTARTQYTVVDIAAQWHGHGYGIFVNGAVIAEWESGMLLQKIAVPASTVSLAAEAARECDLALLLFGIDTEADRGRAVYTDHRRPVHSEWRKQKGGRLIYLDDAASPPRLPVSMAVYGAREPVEAAARLWRERLADVDIYCAYDPPYDAWCAYLNSSMANKAIAAQYVARMLNVPREQTMAIGDHANDVDLLRWAGLGVAVGDGHADALSAADHITLPQHEDGVADAIERFVLGRF